MSGRNRTILPSTILTDNGSKTIVGDSNVDNSVPVSKKSKSPSIMVSNLTPSVLQILLSAVSKDTDDGGEDDGGRSTRGEHERKSHLFCGCCCDLVRACVVTNSVYIALMVFWVLVSVLELPMYQSFRLYNRQPANDDDEFEDDDDDEFLQYKSGMEWRGILTIARTAFGILFAALGIWGASKFHRGLVLSSAIGYGISVWWSILEKSIWGAAFAFVFAYPNVHLFMALNRGSIRKETYETMEEHCCCECCCGAGSD